MPNSVSALRHYESLHTTFKPIISAEEARSQLLDLRLQAHRLEVALNNISQGVCFYDGSRNLVFANRRYAEIYSLPLECIRPGASLAEITEHRLAADTLPNMSVQEYVDWRVEVQFEGLPSDSIVELVDGRTIVIRRRPMPDRGWVSTHEDITERAEREAASASPPRAIAPATPR